MYSLFFSWGRPVCMQAVPSAFLEYPASVVVRRYTRPWRRNGDAGA